MNKYILILSLISFLSYSQNRNEKKVILTEFKELDYSNGREVFSISKSTDEVIFNESLEYFWFNEYSKIKSTIGSAGGNLLHGKYHYFDLTGNLINEVNFYLGLKDGVEKTWGEDGEIIVNNKYSNGNLIYSKFKTDDKNSIIEWIGNAMDEGSVKNIYTSYGKLKQTQKWLKDFKFTVIDYYHNGNVKSTYTSDPLNKMYGECIDYYESGKMKFYGLYEDNWRVGEWIWYDENGLIESTQQNRIIKNYSQDNLIISKGGEYFDDVEQEWIKNGLWIWYDEDGKKILDMKKYKQGDEIDFIEANDY